MKKQQRFYWLLDQLNNNNALTEVQRGNYHVEADSLEQYA